MRYYTKDNDYQLKFKDYSVGQGGSFVSPVKTGISNLLLEEKN